MSVCIGVITSGKIEMECAESLIGVVTTKAANWIFFHKSGPYLDDARNALVKTFKSKEFENCDKLLMVDSDIEFNPDDVKKLAAHDLPVVSGVYWSQFGKKDVLPIIYDWCIKDGKRTMAPINGLPKGDKLFKATAVGTGFLMIKREVLDKMEKKYGDPMPWFDEPVIGGVHFGEDLGFCIRCEEMGIPIYVDPTVQVFHHKQARISGVKS